MTPLPPSHHDPRSTLQRWLPHVLLIGLVVASCGLVLYLLAPLREPILLAACLAALTSPLLFEPIDRLLRKIFPRWGELLRRQFAGIFATIFLLIILLLPFLALVLTTVGSVSQAFEVIYGIATRDAERMAMLFAAVERQTNSLTELYPGLPFSGHQVSEWLSNLLTEASDLGPTFLNFLFKGTSSLLAHFALALIILPNCYAQGGLAARFVMGYTPLSSGQVQALANRHRSVVNRLLSDTILFALCRGILLGGLAWLFVGLPLVPLIAIATFLSLVPAVGTTMVWLPLVIVLWTSGQFVSALLMGLSSLLGSWALSYIRGHVGQRIDEASGIWLSFLLFLGLAAGLLSFGPKGFVIGPMIMVAAILVFAHLLPYYGLGKEEDMQAAGEDAEGPKTE